MKTAAGFIIILILMSMTASSQRPGAVRLNNRIRVPERTELRKERIRLNDRPVLWRDEMMTRQERKMRKAKYKMRKNKLRRFQ